MKSIAIQTHYRTEFVDITAEIQHAVRELSLHSGMVTLFVPHTTAAVTINENADPAVMADMAQTLERMIPQYDPAYTHAEGNSAAHVKAGLLGHSTQILVENGQLCLGTWQGIYFSEFDGPRTRQIWVQPISKAQ